MIKVIFVYRTGGDFNALYVKRLAEAVQENLTLSHEVICLTNAVNEIAEYGIHAVPLVHNWPGWWSKMELFAYEGPVLYLDLDTAIVGDIDGLAQFVCSMKPDCLLMLRGFYRDERCSGILGYSGSMLWLYDRFRRSMQGRHTFHGITRGVSLNCQEGNFRGDQDYIRHALDSNPETIRVELVQDVFAGVRSYKVDVLPDRDRAMKDATVICFHGQPRPHEVEGASWAS